MADISTLAFEPVRPSEGIQIVADITGCCQAGVDTLEGRIGPLLFGGSCQAHYIEMPSGLFLDEHPHGTESLIYTVRGRWVLCSSGVRTLMHAGSLMHFAAGVATGYEVPFEEHALILIFKGARSVDGAEEFVGYLRSLASRLLERKERGECFRLSDLPCGHPALVFAAAVNPSFPAEVD